jgi:hypothetical protein
LVIASHAGAPPFTRSTKPGADGAFEIQSLTGGNYSLCVQVSGDQYLVCADSASYSDFIPLVTPFSGKPTINLSDPTYVHTTVDLGWGSAFVLCGAPANARELFRPPAGQSLYNQIVQVLNAY